MSIRLLCKQTSKHPSNALFYFPEEQKTGIAPTRIIDEKDLDLTPGMVLTVIWDREKIEAQILALDDDLKVLNEKDLEWSREHLTAQTAATEEKRSTNSDTESPNKLLARTKKAGAIIIPDSADHESPVKDVAESAEQTRYLSTINYDTLSNLREENQPSDVPSAAKRQGSASQEVGEKLISTCYPNQNKDHSRNIVKARD
ncbi:uncharacterized protein LOC122951801 [Acropora millepora]|uniref:uncharacterized protein LOC122951801 n=1 Tax=Acropora millepora TaxID=45264 RepID=UPI001CF22D83|nr:uncharacterized protein LOC122951801 [Acropora millepora]